MTNRNGIFIETHGRAILHRGIGFAALVKYLFLISTIATVFKNNVILPPLSWLSPPSSTHIYFTLSLCLVANLLFIFGVKPLFTGSITALGLLSTFAIDLRIYGNHVYLIAVLVSIIAFGLERTDTGYRLGPLGVGAIRLQLSIVYLFAALSKLNVFYLSGESLNNLWSKQGLLPLPDDFRVWWILSIPATFAVLLEAALALLIWIPKYRLPVMCCGVIFHCIVIMITPNPDFAVFTLVMLICYLSFFVSDPATTLYGTELNRDELNWRQLKR